MKICEKVVTRCEPSGPDDRLFWSEDTKKRYPGIVFEQWFSDDIGSFFEMYINSEKFQLGDRLKITVEKVEGEE